MSSFFHDLGQFVRQDFRRKREPVDPNLINGFLIFFFLVWTFGGFIAVIAVSIIFSWWYMFLLLLWLFVVRWLWRFGTFYSDKHRTKERWG